MPYIRSTTSGLHGINEVMANLNKALENYKAVGFQGMQAASSYIREDTEKTSPKTPVKTGKLRASWHTSNKRRGNQLSHTFGYSAWYGKLVHENLTAKRWTRPGSGPWWFYEALLRNRHKILIIMGDYMKRGKIL